MKILVLTPLFPPDIGGSAPYIKELVTRLSNRKYSVTVLAYGCLPEDVPGVMFRCVNKKIPTFLRIFLFSMKTFREARKHDFIYAENGPSVELPLRLLKFFLKTPLVFHIGDHPAYTYGQTKPFLNKNQKVVERYAHTVVEETPEPRPEILPHKKYPTDLFKAYEKSWDTHLEKLEHIFHYVR